MKFCPKCGLKHEDSVEICDCGYDLRGIRPRPKIDSAPAGLLTNGNFVPGSQGNYDAQIIQTYARRLYSEAALTLVISTSIGVLIGLGGALFIWQRPNDAFDFFGGLVFLALAAGLGYWVGHRRSFALQLQAQLALCLVQLEENTR